MLLAVLGKERRRRGHHEHAEVAGVIIQIVEGVVVKCQRLAFEIERGHADLLGGRRIGEHQQMRNDRCVEQRVEPLKGHHVLAELDIGVGLEKLAALGRVIKFVARHELDLDARAFAEDAAVFGRGLELGEVHAHLAAEIKTVELARGRQETGVENIRRRLVGFGNRPDGIRELVILVVGVLLGEEEFHKFIEPQIFTDETRL